MSMHVDDFMYRASPWAVTLVLHNWPVMAYSVLFAFAAVRAFVRPTRLRLLQTYGFLSLIVAFEYQKHGAPEMRVTSEYLFSVEGNPWLRQANLFFWLDVLPITLHVVGIGLVVLSVVWSRRQGPSSIPSVRAHRLAHTGVPHGIRASMPRSAWRAEQASRSEG
jgi:hypothetical protein